MSNGNYAVSFLDLPNHTCYSNPMGVQLKGGDLSGETTIEAVGNKFNEIALKAINTETGGAGTAGFGMIPVNVDPRVVDITRKYTPLVELVPRVTNTGMFADYNQLTAKGGGVTAAEDAALTETTTTYDRQSTAIKYLYAVGRVTGPAKAGMPSWILEGLTPAGGSTGAFNDSTGTNATQLEILVKAREIRELEESLIVNGDASTDATQFSGIVKLMGATNTVDKNSSALSLDDITKAVRYATDDSGRPNLAVCDTATFEDLLNLLTAKIGFMQPMKEVFWGFSTIVLNTQVGAIPVIWSQYLSNTANAKSIYFLDMSVIEMRVLQDMTFENFGKNNDSDKFMLKVYETFIIKNTAFCSSITEIA